jgi:flagellar basal-body rod protein FlgG
MSKSTVQVIYSSRSGLMSNMMDMDVVSNNIANANTIGYKSARSNFQELLNQQTQSGVQIRATQMDNAEGDLRVSSRALDLAVDGAGYFAVTLPDNTTAYTRDGEFTLDAASNIVTAQGYKLVWQGAIPATAEEVKVDPNGAVMTRTGTTWTQAGTLNLARFPNPSALTAAGHSLFLATTAAGTPQTGAPGSTNFGTVRGYSLEGSNVDMTREMTHMITLQRAFQLSASFFQQTDTMISQALHMRR